MSHWISGEQWRVAFHLPTSPKKSRVGSPRLGLHNAGSRGQQCEVVGLGRHVNVGDGAVQHKVVKEGWRDEGFM